MARKRKCVCCGEYIGTGEESVPYKGRYAHTKCFNIALKAVQIDKTEKLKEPKEKAKKKKPKAELKDAVSEEEYAEKKQYYQYLHDLINEDLSAKIYALSDHYISRYGFTYKGMYQSLVYMHEIIEKDLQDDVVGLIPFYYTDAENYYISVSCVENGNKNKDISKMYQEKTILIKPKQRKNLQIDINSVGKEE